MDNKFNSSNYTMQRSLKTIVINITHSELKPWSHIMHMNKFDASEHATSDAQWPALTISAMYFVAGAISPLPLVLHKNTITLRIGQM